MRRICILATIALLVPACAFGSATAGPVGPTSTTLALSSSVEGAATSTSAPAVATTPVPIGTTPSAQQVTTTTSAPLAPTATPTGPIEVAPYFFVDEAGHPARSGPFLLPVARKVPATLGVARAAIDQLLLGPSADERAGTPAISTFVRDGVDLLGLTIEDGVATVDLSGELEVDDGSAATTLGVAQIVFTLTRFDTVGSVLIRQDGEAVAAPTGDGKLVTRPVHRDDYFEFVAALSVERPAYGGFGGGPLRVTGLGAVFEAAFSFALVDDDGVILDEGRAMTSNGTGWGSFDFTIDNRVDEPMIGSLIVWTHSAADGSQIDVREYPVLLQP